MNEKQKMISGELYFAGDKELVDARNKAKTLCQQYNSLLPLESEKKEKLIKKLFGQIGENFCIEPNFFCDYGFNIYAGKNFYINHNCVILDCAKVSFGDNVFIGPNCGFYTAEHPLDVKTRNEFLEYAKPITIGNNVWIGGSVSILSGVTVGDNVVIGAGANVVSNVPDNVVVVGNPAKIIKQIIT